MAEVRSALARVPYLSTLSAEALGGVPYMVQGKVRVSHVEALVDAIKADISNVLEMHVFRGRKTARLVRDTDEGFDLLFAIMDDEGYFVTAKLDVLLK